MHILWAILLVLLLPAAWVMTLVGMPGNWVMVAAAALYAWVAPADLRLGIGWETVAALFGLALVGEILELAAGMLGAARAGASRRGAAMALAGSLAGGLVGLFVGLPIPLVGSLVAAVLFASLGAMAGAVLGEQWKGRDLIETWQVGKGAFLGRLAGTLAKAAIGAVMIVVTLTALVV
jgi:hypothetical protein